MKTIENNDIRLEITKLREENAYLQQLIPSGENAKPMHDIIHQYQRAITEAKKMKSKYKAAIREAKQMKKEYKKKMDRLIKTLEHENAVIN